MLLFKITLHMPISTQYLINILTKDEVSIQDSSRGFSYQTLFSQWISSSMGCIPNHLFPLRTQGLTTQRINLGRIEIVLIIEYYHFECSKF